MKIISKYSKIIILSLLSLSVKAQQISGNLSLLANQSIILQGFKGLKTYPISSSIIDEDGNFKLTYAKTDFGVGYLMSADNKYYVFGTPTMFLLDKKREIILRPISVQQMDAWVDWFLKKQLS